MSGTAQANGPWYRTCSTGRLSGGCSSTLGASGPAAADTHSSILRKPIRARLYGDPLTPWGPCSGAEPGNQEPFLGGVQSLARWQSSSHVLSNCRGWVDISHLDGAPHGTGWLPGSLAPSREVRSFQGGLQVGKPQPSLELSTHSQASAGKS